MTIDVDYSGRTVLVTGGGTGLGLAIAEAFGRAGARVALNDLSTERVEQAVAQLTSEGIACRGFAADVRHAPAVRDLVGQVVSALGVPDIAIANAGIYPNTPFLEMREEEWDQVLDTNLKGVFLTCQTVAKAMVSANRTGQFIVIASGAASTAISGWSHYCSSKAAVVMLARSMALELGGQGLRVNVISPGYIDVAEGGAHLAEAYKDTARTSIPIGRPGEPADVARAALMLASPLASYVNGAVLAVDGGSSAGRIGAQPRPLPETIGHFHGHGAGEEESLPMARVRK